MSRPSPSPASSPRASCRAMTRSRTRPRSSTTCSASSPSPISAATTSPISRPTRSATTVLGGGVDRGQGAGLRRSGAKRFARLRRLAGPRALEGRQADAGAERGQGSPRVHVGGSGAHGGFVQGATALKGELAERAALSVGSSLAPQVETVAEKRAEARMKGYVGESCPECGNFTMVRNGTCLKCDTCGGTTGCS